MASLRVICASVLALVLGACGDGDSGPDPIAEGILALDGNQVVAVDTDAGTIEPVGQPIPAGLTNARLLASLDNSRLMLTGSTGGTGVTALYVMRFGTWDEVVTDATQVFTTVDLRFYGYRRDVTSAEPGTRVFMADGTPIFETTDSTLRVSSALDGQHAFLRDGAELVIFDADGVETRFDPMLLTDWRPRLATGSRVLLGPSDIGSWYTFDGVMGDTVTAEGAGVGYLLEMDGRLTFAREAEDVEVATMLPPDATRAITSDSSQVLIDDNDGMRVFSPDGTEIASILPEVYTGEPPAGAMPADTVRLRDIAAAIPNAGVFVTHQHAADGSASFATIVHFSVAGGGATQETLTALPIADGDLLGDRPDERVVPWAEGTTVHHVDPLTGAVGSFDGLSGSNVSWARYPGGRGHRLPGD